MVVLMLMMPMPVVFMTMILAVGMVVDRHFSEKLPCGV
jgi:hypothetical protein